MKDFNKWLNSKMNEYNELQMQQGENVLKMVELLHKLSDHMGDKYQECVDLVNQYSAILTHDNWINNGDGTFTAKKGATLFELQEATGRNWTTSDYQGEPKNLQIGQIVSFAAKNDVNSYNTVDSTDEALRHYFNGNGAPVNIGLNSIRALQSHPEQLRRQDRITTGQTEGPNEGNYPIDMTRVERTYFIGQTRVDYSATYGNKFAVIDFTAFRYDGFWDVVLTGILNRVIKGDGPGPKYELRNGKPYPFIPYNWTISVPNPYL
jgi:hypothetical protein